MNNSHEPRKLYRVQLAMFVEGYSSQQVATIYSSEDGYLMLPFESANNLIDREKYRELSSSPNDRLGIEKATRKALMNSGKVPMGDIRCLSSTLISRNDGDETRFNTYHVTTPLKKDDFRRHILFVPVDSIVAEMVKVETSLVKRLEELTRSSRIFEIPAEELEEQIKKAKRIILPVNGRRYRISRGVTDAIEALFPQDLYQLCSE